ncbi:MAG: hypothetical protein AAB734_01110, partial [Patescibacteria group bacterium]
MEPIPQAQYGFTEEQLTAPQESLLELTEQPEWIPVILREMRYGSEQLNELVNFRSGLAGVSGFSSDMKVLLERRDNAPSAALAVELFCYQARKTIGALAATLGGLDTLVFTGGIGERAVPVRTEICQGLEFLGAQLDAR